MKANIEKFDELVSTKQSGWHNKVQESIDNPWRDKAFDIALRLINYMRENGFSQTQLSDKLRVSRQYVNRILQGKENLSLETICSIEFKLGICIIEIPNIQEYHLEKFKFIACDSLSVKNIGLETIELNSSKTIADYENTNDNLYKMYA